MIENKLEQILDLVLDDLVDDRERFYGPKGELWEPLGEYRRAADAWTPLAFSDARAISRRLYDENPFACNAIENRISYIVAEGHTYDIQPASATPAAEAVARQLRDWLDAWIDHNDWTERQVETTRRTDRDGECFLRMFTDNAGMTTLRYVDPEQVRQPQRQTSHPAPYGIEFAPDDAEQPIRYWVDDRAVPADRIQHRKRHTDRNVPRGVPLLHPVRKNLRRAGLLLRNMSALVEVQSSIALIRKHAGKTSSGIEAFAQAQASATSTSQVTGQTKHFHSYGPGTILDTGAGVEYDFPGIQVKADSMVDCLRAELRAIAARLVFPEYMLTSDASNAAYASTLVAEGPAERMFEREQARTAREDIELIRRSIRKAMERGALPPSTLDLVKLRAIKPDVHVRDFAKANIVRARLFAAGVLSPQTWSTQLGLDYEREQQLLDQHYAENPDAPRTPIHRRDLARSNFFPPTAERPASGPAEDDTAPPVERALS